MSQKSSARDATRCIWNMTAYGSHIPYASGAQSGASPSRIEGFREFEADLSALFYGAL